MWSKRRELNLEFFVIINRVVKVVYVEGEKDLRGCKCGNGDLMIMVFV